MLRIRAPKMFLESASVPAGWSLLAVAAMLRAIIAYVESGPEAAIELLSGERDVDSLNLKAGLILETDRPKRAEECRAVLDFEGTDLEPDAETFRLRALSYLVSKDLA